MSNYSYNQKDYFDVLLNTMSFFDSFCLKNGLTYFADSGTLLGAIRHKGFIPWDDDIDVSMPRKDYERLLSLKESLLDTDYEIQDMTDPRYPSVFAKFVFRNSSVWECEETPFVYGVYIDIFPLDNTELDIPIIKKNRHIYKKLASLYSRSLRDNFCKTSINQLKTFVGFRRWCINVFAIKPLKLFWRKRFLSFSKKLQQDHGDHYIVYYWDKCLFPKDWFSNQLRVPFENIEIMICNGWHEYLTQVYGDYMTPPPVEKRISNHRRYFSDLQKRYSIEEIKQINQCEN